MLVSAADSASQPRAHYIIVLLTYLLILTVANLDLTLVEHVEQIRMSRSSGQGQGHTSVTKYTHSRLSAFD